MVETPFTTVAIVVKFADVVGDVVDSLGVVVVVLGVLVIEESVRDGIEVVETTSVIDVVDVDRVVEEVGNGEGDREVVDVDAGEVVVLISRGQRKSQMRSE